MGFGFRKLIRIAPGVNLNISHRGAGASVGVRGARLSVSRKGVRRTLSIPGTGLYHVATVKAPRRRKSARPNRKRIEADRRGWFARLIG